MRTALPRVRDGASAERITVHTCGFVNSGEVPTEVADDRKAAPIPGEGLAVLQTLIEDVQRQHLFHATGPLRLGP